MITILAPITENTHITTPEITMTEKEQKVVALLNGALDRVLVRIGQEVDSKREAELLEQAVKYCHQIKSLQPAAK